MPTGVSAQFFVGRDGSYFLVDGTWFVNEDSDWATHTTMALNPANLRSTTKGGVISAADALSAPTQLGLVFNGGAGFAYEGGTLHIDNFGTIPEPASLSLIGLVTGGIYFARRFFIA